MAEKKDKKQTFNTKLYEVCGDDELRPILQCVQFRDGFAYATNGHISIKQTLDFQSVLNKDLLDGKLLHRNNYKAIMGFEMAECDDDGIRCWNTDGQEAYFPFHDAGDGPVPNIADAMQQQRGLTGLTFLGIDPDQFAKLAKAIYNPENNMRLQFTGINSAILVDVVGVEDQEGILMPISINGSLF